jgi:5-methylcytosine-specific restriction protein A
MQNDPSPSIENAVAAIDVIRRSNKTSGCSAGLAVAIVIAIAFVDPTALFALLIILPTIAVLNRNSCKASEKLLIQFARDRNWFLNPRTELRHVAGQPRRKRFYLAPVLFPTEFIIARIRSGDFSSDPAPPSGEVPKHRPSRNSSQPTGDTQIPRRDHDEPSRPRSISPATKKRPTAGKPASGGRHGNSDESPKSTRVQQTQITEIEQPALEQKQRHDKELTKLEEDRRNLIQRQRLEEEKIAEELRARIESQQRRAEEARRRLDDPRFKIFLEGKWTSFLSVRSVWLLIEEGKATLSDSAVEKGDGRILPLEQFPDLAALFDELVIPNTHVQRNQRRRDPREKSECITFHGTICAICGFSFAEAYGEIGEGYIEVHHLKPISEDGDLIARIINPITDLRPVCANCHRMLHTKSPPYSIEEMIAIRSSRISGSISP